MKGGRGRQSALAGGLAKEGFQKEVTHAESGQHLKWEVHSKQAGQAKESTFWNLRYSHGWGLQCSCRAVCDRSGDR